MTASSAETRLAELMGRLLTTAEAALATGDLDLARSTADDVRTVDPDNERAAEIIARITAARQTPVGERALMTLLFSDVVDSTALSERVEPEAMRDIFDRYRREAHIAVERYGGQVVKYLGDGVLASFGYPQAHEDDARRAVLAALDLTASMAAAEAELEADHGVVPHIRVGVHTGRVVVADLGSGAAREHESIVGAAPNLAARIQAEAEPGMVAVSDVTHAIIEAEFDFDSLGLRSLKGVSRPVEVFAVTRARSVIDRLDAVRFRQARLVGRSAAIERLTGAWEVVRGASGRPDPGVAILVAGEAGIGKSRLAADLRRHVARSAGDTLATACSAYYANIALWPIAGMLERVLDLPDDDRALDALEDHLGSLGMEAARAVPFFAPLLDLPAQARFPAPLLDPAAIRLETLACVRDWLARLARAQPRLLLVEDLHWADPSTLELLGGLVSQPPPGLLTVMTTRADHEIPWVASVEEIGLGRLSDEDATRLVSDIAASHRLNDETTLSIVARAEGIPLFIEELTRSAMEEGDDPLPMRLQELLTGRLKGPRVDLRVAQVAATVGATFSTDTVTAVVGDTAQASAAIAELEASGIIEPDGDAGSGAYHFRHALMRDAAYETQMLDVRKATHDQVAGVLSEAGDDDALIAHHFDLASDPAQAVTHYIAGAQRSQGGGAHAEAIRLLSRSLELVAELPEGEGRDLTEVTALMLRVLSTSSTQGYAAPGLQDDQRRAEALTERLAHRPEVSFSVIIAIWAYWLTNGDLGTAGHLAGRLLHMVQDEALAWFRPEVEACAGFQSFYEGDVAQARTHLDAAIAGFSTRPADQMVSPLWPLPNDPYAVTAIAIACVETLAGDLVVAAEWEERAVARAEECGFPQGPFSLAFVKTYMAWNRRIVGDPTGAEALGAEVVRIGQQYGYAYWLALGSMYMVAPTPGETTAADAMTQSIATLRAIGHEAFMASSLGYLAQLWEEGGMHDQAIATIGEALLVAEKTGERLHVPELLTARALLRRSEAPVEAGADLAEAINLAERHGLHLIGLRAAVAQAELPPSARTGPWREQLEAALARMPAGVSLAETSAAESILAG